MNKSRHIKKETLLKALEKSLGVVTIACKKADIPRSTYYKWLKDDDEFRQQVQEIENVALDFAEISEVWFAIDGLEDTHSIYRQGTNWKKIIDNVMTFVDAGGKARWDMLVFQHNEHQVEYHTHS